MGAYRGRPFKRIEEHSLGLVPAASDSAPEQSPPVGQGIREDPRDPQATGAASSSDGSADGGRLGRVRPSAQDIEACLAVLRDPQQARAHQLVREVCSA